MATKKSNSENSKPAAKKTVEQEIDQAPVDAKADENPVGELATDELPAEVPVIKETRSDLTETETVDLTGAIETKKPLTGKTVSPRPNTTGKVRVWDPAKRSFITGYIDKHLASQIKRDYPHVEINKDEQE